MPTTPPPNSSSSPVAGDDPSAAPAYALWVELATRILTQPLHYRSGDEETAATSVSSVFSTVRKLLAAHKEAQKFRILALALINDTLRPYTARWHGWMTQDGEKLDETGKPLLKFRDEWVRRKFREELRELQPRIVDFQKAFEIMGAGEMLSPEVFAALTAGGAPTERTAKLGADLPLTVRGEVALRQAQATGTGRQKIRRQIRELERAAILHRRRVLRPAVPALPINATGLALSGGGIRSATFCLGVVQELQRHGLFEHFDYLSTVSGGGYLGCFISSYLGADPEQLEAIEQEVKAQRAQPLGTATASPHPTPTGAPDAAETKATRERLAEVFNPPESRAESPALRHLRNNSRYLLHGGKWGLMRIAGVFVTGFITSLLMLLTLPLAVAWILRGMKEPAVAEFFTQHLWLLEPWREMRFANLTFAALSMGFFEAFTRKLKMGTPSKIPTVLAGLALALWTLVALRALGLAAVYPPGLELSAVWRHPAGIACAGMLFLLAILWLLMPLAQRWSHGTKWDSKPAHARSLIESATLLAALGAAIIGAVCAAFPLVAGYEYVRENLGNLVGHALHWKPPELLSTALLSFVPALFGGLTRRGDGSVRGWAQMLFYLTAPAFFLIAFLVFASNLGVGTAHRWGPFFLGSLTDFHVLPVPLGAPWDLHYAAWISLALLIWALAFLNINTFAPHRYYRNRLCECYLAMRDRQQRPWLGRTIDRLFHGVRDGGSTEAFRGVGSLQRLPLRALSACAAAPYHLINATLNAEASKNPELRGRNGDFFIFTRHFCGSPLTGYMPTEDLEKVDPHVDLGTAMAISGAAASTNMGWQTIRRLRFLMTLFNVRLGYWMRRPGSTGGWWSKLRVFEAPGPFYFVREMLGAVHERTRYVNLSDGGHIENLAVYELLRRQCKFIVCVDAGMEPGMECADLMRLQRYAGIDLGIRLDFELTDLTTLPTGYSRAYALLVKIDYAPAANAALQSADKKLGWMLYVKLAVTGTEPRYVLDYRRQNPAFPHQTTADQFYDEAQFEAYRALGECAGASLFRDEITGTASPADLRAWFQTLADNLLADNDEAFSPGSGV